MLVAKLTIVHLQLELLFYIQTFNENVVLCIPLWMIVPA